jgi:hypothetical protein
VCVITEAVRAIDSLVATEGHQDIARSANTDPCSVVLKFPVWGCREFGHSPLFLRRLRGH